MTVDKKTTLFATRGVQPGAPHMASYDLGLARETETLYYHGAGQVRHYIFPEAGPEYLEYGPISGYSAPLNYGGADLLWNKLRLGNILAPFPWRFSEGCRKIRVGATIATQSDAILAFRASTETLVTDVVSTYGSHMTGQARAAPNMLRWRRSSQSDRDMTRFLRLWSTIDNPDVPPDRRVAVCPWVALNQPSTGSDVWIYLVDMVAMDLPDQESTGA